MPYHPQIPQSTDNPKNSQGDLLDNFQAINSQFLINHVGLTATSNRGFHTKVQFPAGLAYTADPNLAAPAASLYPKTVPGNTTELFFQNGATNFNVAQMTNLPLINMTIKNITNDPVSGVIETAVDHGLNDGVTVLINGAYGMNINGVVATVTVVDQTHFKTGINTNALGAYTANSGYYTITSPTTSKVENIFGMKTPWGLIFNFGFAGANATVNFPIQYPGGFKPLYAGISPTTTALFGVTTFSATQLKYACLSAKNYFLVIGK